MTNVYSEYWHTDRKHGRWVEPFHAKYNKNKGLRNESDWKDETKSMGQIFNEKWHSDAMFSCKKGGGGVEHLSSHKNISVLNVWHKIGLHSVLPRLSSFYKKNMRRVFLDLYELVRVANWGLQGKSLWRLYTHVFKEFSW